MRIVLTNLSNSLYIASRLKLNDSAAKFGIVELSSYNFDEIKGSSFFKENKEILIQQKGIGYWLWKPYIILETLKGLDDGDITIYSDCGIEIIDDLKPLIDLCDNETDILLFTNSNYTNKIWTKRDCFVLMNCDEERYWNGIHCDAAFCLFKKSAKSIKFLEEWLFYGSNINIITDLPNICGAENFPKFIEHRRDQSILSLLAIKYNLVHYRMPTQFGNHYKLPKYRVANEFNCVKQGDQTQLNYYSSLPCQNSHYYQLLNHHRKKSEININQNEVMAEAKNTSISNLKLIHFKSLVKRGIKKLIRINPANVPIIKNQHEKQSYSQCGEDLIVQYIFNLRGINKPSYIDIGANHPFFISNTAMFYEQGCRGINIEANPQLINDLIKYRPEDVNLNIGIDDKEGELDFYIMKDNTLSTFSKEQSDLMVSHGKVLAEIKKIKLAPLSNILEKYSDNKFPDFMSIDVEGMDFQILQSTNFSKSFPKIICVEAAEYSPIGAGPRRNELIDFIVSKGYYEYANTNLNAIMVKNEFWFI